VDQLKLVVMIWMALVCMIRLFNAGRHFGDKIEEHYDDEDANGDADADADADANANANANGNIGSNASYTKTVIGKDVEEESFISYHDRIYHLLLVVVETYFHLNQ
jgi:hypothetical protein